MKKVQTACPYSGTGCNLDLDVKNNKIKLVEVEFVTSKIKSTVEKYGANSMMGFSSASCTNEDNYTFQKLFRTLGTNNIDHCAKF